MKVDMPLNKETKPNLCGICFVEMGVGLLFLSDAKVTDNFDVVEKGENFREKKKIMSSFMKPLL